ncbi:MAG TPA: hypothetical protein QGF58_30635 [Myxococcota bacterium]|nr:hypothetical protein [Myxococcota bacterium]
MDYRCLYGHRTPSSFGFAIEQGVCPSCGAPIVSVVGYQIARKLAATVPLDPVLAFATLRVLENEYDITPKAVTEDEAEVSMAEIEIDEAEVENTAVEVEETAAVETNGATAAVAVASVAVDDTATDLPSEEAPPPPVFAEAEVEESLSDVEKDFFASGEVTTP